MTLELPRAEAGRSRYDCDNREDGAVFHDLLKAKRRPAGVPAGFTFIPKSKHQGYRKRKGDHWIYWYPDQHRHEDHLDWEPDYAAGTGVGGIKAGQFVAIVGDPGVVYAWTPDARAHKPGKTWITPVDPDDGHPHGKPVLVDPGRLQPQKSFDPAARRKRRQSKKRTAAKRAPTKRSPAKKRQATKPRAAGKKRQSQKKRTAPAATPKTSIEAQVHRRRMAHQAQLIDQIKRAEEMLSRTGRKQLRSPDRIARLKLAIVDAKEGLRNLRTDVGVGKLTDSPTEEARTVVFAESRAPKGTFLHKLENGYYPLLAFEADDRMFNEGGTKQRSTGVFVPPQDVKGLFDEFGGLMGNSARKVSNTYRIRTPEGREDVLSGAKLGMMMALRSYSGGVPFAAHAQRYANLYAQRAAREYMGGGGATIPARQMQMLHGLIAARARAFAKHGSEADVDQIAKEWRVPKSQTFTGRSSTLGKYVRTGKRGKAKGKSIVVDQAAEQTPLDLWQVRDPEGKPVGKKYMGKRQLVQAMTPILEGARVEDSEWMNQHEGQLIPAGADSSLPQGTKHSLRTKIDEIMGNMSAQNAEVLSVLYGLDASPFEPRGASTARVRGEHRAVNAEDLATILGLADAKDSLRTKQRKAEAAVKRAEQEFRLHALEHGYDDVAARTKRWNHMVSANRPEIKPATGPSHAELAERFGGNERVHIYGAAVRAGEGANVAKLLEKWKAGKLTARQRGKLLREHRERRDAERLVAFNRQTAHRVIDPEEVADVRAGSDPEALWLYTDELLLGAAQAIANGASSGKPLRPKRGDSKVWDEGRFQRYMGRAQQYAAARGGKDG